jgi:hypothetical protein
MDSNSTAVVALLESLQDARARLVEVWHHYSAKGATQIQTVFNLSGRPFTAADAGASQEYRGSLAMGLLVVGPNGREYDLAVDLMWDGEAWTIDAEAWVADEKQNQVRLRALPRRSATELDACRTKLLEAVDELKSFDDIVFGE